MHPDKLYVQEMHFRYLGYMNSDIGLLSIKSGKYDVINGSIAQHLAEIYAYITVYGECEEFIEEYERLVGMYGEAFLNALPEDEKDLAFQMINIFAL